MRFKPAPNNCALTTLALAAVSIALSGCDRLTPNGTSGTVSLLRSGSERVCVASDVQQILHGLIVPKAAASGSSVSQTDASAAIAGVSISFEATTLQATDKTVNKATCSTVARIEGADGTANRFHIIYAVSPSADNPNAVVVDGDVDDAKAFARARIDSALDLANETKAQQQQTLEQQQARQKLLAMLTPRWLVGTWIDATADAANCSSGQGFTFRANHIVEGAVLNGRWVLSEDRLHAVGQGQSGGAGIDGTISEADPLSFVITGKDGNVHTLRRCTHEEASPYPGAGAPDTFVPAPSQN